MASAERIAEILRIEPELVDDKQGIKVSSLTARSFFEMSLSTMATASMF
ncbi:MAG: hypothetical protein IPJ07_17170 [Acidobacteria bacterium]|nr:hypothetical protein [Acidobacteriota bacterium]